MAVDARTLAILACPLCKGKLVWLPATQQLVCRADKLAYPVRDDIPMLLRTVARELTLDELEQLPS